MRKSGFFKRWTKKSLLFVGVAFTAFAGARDALADVLPVFETNPAVIGAEIDTAVATDLIAGDTLAMLAELTYISVWGLPNVVAAINVLKEDVISSAQISAMAGEKIATAQDMVRYQDAQARNSAAVGATMAMTNIIACQAGSALPAVQGTARFAKGVAAGLESAATTRNAGPKAVGGTLKDDIGAIQDMCAAGALSATRFGSGFLTALKDRDGADCSGAVPPKDAQGRPIDEADVKPLQVLFYNETLEKPKQPDLDAITTGGLTIARYNALPDKQKLWISANMYCDNLMGQVLPSDPRDDAAKTPEALVAIRANKVAMARLNTAIDLCRREVAYRTAYANDDMSTEAKDLRDAQATAKQFMEVVFTKNGGSDAMPAGVDFSNMSQYQMDKFMHHDWLVNPMNLRNMMSQNGDEATKQGNVIAAMKMAQQWKDNDDRRLNDLMASVTTVMEAQSSFVNVKPDRPTRAGLDDEEGAVKPASFKAKKRETTMREKRAEARLIKAAQIEENSAR